MGKKKIVARIFFWLQQATAVWLRHRTPFAYGGDNDWMGYLLRQRTILLRFDANNRSCVVHLPRDAADQQVHAKLSLLLLPRTGVPLPHVYDKENVSISLQIVTCLLLRWRRSGAPPIASTAPRNTRSLLWWLHMFKRDLDTSRLRTANRQTSPSMMVGPPRNLQGCMHHTHL